MAQVMVPKKQNDSGLLQAGGTAGGSALGGPIGGAAGGLLGGQLSQGGGQVQSTQAQAPQVPQAGDVPKTQTPQVDNEAIANNNAALQRRLQLLNQTAQQATA